MKWDVFHTTRLTVMTPPLNATLALPMYIPPISIAIKWCCCFKGGNILLGGACSSNIIAAGDIARINYVVMNRSTAKIQEVVVTLNEECIYSANGRQRVARSVLFRERIQNNPDAVNDLSPQNGGNTDVSDTEYFQRMQQILNDPGAGVVNVRVPLTARPTMKGKLIEVRHHFCIFAHTGFGYQDAEVTRFVTIHHNNGVAPDAALLQFNAAANPVPTGVPIGWAPVHQALVVMPPPSYQAATAEMTCTGEIDDYNTPSALPIASAPPLYFNDSTTQNPVNNQNPRQDPLNLLLTSVVNSFDQSGEVKKWLQFNNPDIIAPAQYFTLFQSIRLSMYQVEVASLLAMSLSGITCAHIAAAGKGSDDVCRSDVVSKLASARVLDKENRNLVQAVLSPFQFMIVEHLFA